MLDYLSVGGDFEKPQAQRGDLMRIPCYIVLGSLLLSSVPAIAQTAASPETASPPAQKPAVSDDSAAAKAPAASNDSGNVKLAMGVRWTYQQKDNISNEVKGTLTFIVTDVTADKVGVRLEILGKQGYGFQTYDRSWNMIGNGQVNYVPNNGLGFKLPLSVGKTWAFHGDQIQRARDVSFHIRGTSKVVGQESITTQAGTFDTFKIETTYSAYNVSDPTKIYKFETETWYAPAIDHWAKQTSTTRFEGHVRQSSTSELLEFDSGS